MMLSEVLVLGNSAMTRVGLVSPMLKSEVRRSNCKSSPISKMNQCKYQNQVGRINNKTEQNNQHTVSELSLKKLKSYNSVLTFLSIAEANCGLLALSSATSVGYTSPSLS